jgi:hypothetical protein
MNTKQKVTDKFLSQMEKALTNFPQVIEAFKNEEFETITTQSKKFFERKDYDLSLKQKETILSSTTGETNLSIVQNEKKESTYYKVLGIRFVNKQTIFCVQTETIESFITENELLIGGDGEPLTSISKDSSIHINFLND